MNLLEIRDAISCLEKIDNERLRCKNTGHIFVVGSDSPAKGIACCPLSGTYLDTTDFITTQSLVAHVQCLIPYIAVFDFDAVISISRSGFLPGTLIATLLHIPLFSVNIKARKVIDPGQGNRMHTAISVDELAKKRCLVIDDSTAGGTTAQIVHEILQEQGFSRENYIYLVIYGSELAQFNIDLVGFRYPLPHYFEWNYLNAHYMRDAGCAFQGVFVDDYFRILHRNNAYPLNFLFVTSDYQKKVATMLMQQRYILPTEIVVGTDDPGSKVQEIRKRRVLYFVEPDPEHAKYIAENAEVHVICPKLQKILKNGKRTVIYS